MNAPFFNIKFFLREAGVLNSATELLKCSLERGWDPETTPRNCQVIAERCQEQQQRLGILLGTLVRCVYTSIFIYLLKHLLKQKSLTLPHKRGHGVLESSIIDSSSHKAKDSNPGLPGWEVESFTTHWCLPVVGFPSSLCGKGRRQEEEMKRVFCYISWPPAFGAVWFCEQRRSSGSSISAQGEEIGFSKGAG